LVTPSRWGAAAVVGLGHGRLPPSAARAELLARRWQAAAVAVTRGADGVVLWAGEGPALAVPSPPAVGDPCGAGDRFASFAAGMLADGALPSEAVTAAVAAASRFVGSGGAGAVTPGAGSQTPSAPTGGNHAYSLARRVRSGGGTVVATGGCFDLLHAGHIATLEAARALGDCLVVCLNSDASVRRLKGEDRPVVPQADRAAVLEGLECVDAVVTFDEDTPARALEGLRPHLFVKGGDYGVADLAEGEILAAWGGRAVVVPYLEGRSTTTLVAAAGRASS
ncbi:MAG: D-glycero-beta-D-manno-heptose 1-phosphate adenylyltransferase, partial [Acidimicrobiales bacterium]